MERKAFKLAETAQTAAFAKVSSALAGRVKQETVETYARNLKALKVKNEGDALVQACMDYLEYVSGTFQEIYNEAIGEFAGKVSTLELQLGIYRQYAKDSTVRATGVSRGFEQRAAATEASLQTARADLESAKKQFAPMLEGIAELRMAKNQIIEMGSNK